MPSKQQCNYLCFAQHYGIRVVYLCTVQVSPKLHFNLIVEPASTKQLLNMFVLMTAQFLDKGWRFYYLQKG